jgi:hypothetical protein
MLDELKQYTGFKGGIPNFNMVIGWASTDLMITGFATIRGEPDAIGLDLECP